MNSSSAIQASAIIGYNTIIIPKKEPYWTESH
jgi:hypothetical protein